MKEKHKVLEILESHKNNLSHMEESDPSSINIAKDLKDLKIDDDFSNEDQLYDEYVMDKYNSDSKLLENFKEVEKEDK